MIVSTTNHQIQHFEMQTMLHPEQLFKSHNTSKKLFDKNFFKLYILFHFIFLNFNYIGFPKGLNVYINLN